MSDEWPFTFPRVEFNAAENVGNQCGHVWNMNEVVSWSCDRPKGHDDLHGTDIWRGHPLRWTENGVPTPVTADARHSPPPARSRAEATNAALSARLERVRALAEKWEQHPLPAGRVSTWTVGECYAYELRAALGEDE